MADDDEKAFSPVETARMLIDAARTASLATLHAGAPYVSLVTVATDGAGAPVLLLSSLAVHTRNIKADPRASLLFTEAAAAAGAGDPLVSARVTLSGAMAPDLSPETRARFLARHPDAELYVDFSDFAFYRLDAASAHLVAGFGRIVDIAPEELFGDGLAHA